jgi:hypothetical protein
MWTMVDRCHESLIADRRTKCSRNWTSSEEDGHKSSLQLRIQKPRNPRPLRLQELAWFLPTVMNHVEKYQRKGSKEWTGHSELDGYSVCFDNRSDNQVHMIFDIILVSDDLVDDEETDGGVGIHSKHSTPLRKNWPPVSVRPYQSLTKCATWKVEKLVCESQRKALISAFDSSPT